MGEASSRAEEIFEQADVQAQGAERMVAAVNEVTGVAATNVAAVDVVAGAAEGQIEAMIEVVAGAQALASIARELAEATARARSER